MSAPILEQSCPACDGRFTVGSASRRKKVQCPQCREIVTLSPPSELNGTPDTSAGHEVPAAPDWMVRCEMLQARIEALEQQVEALTVAPRTRSSLIPERVHDFSPVSRERLLPRDPAESHDGASPADGGERREIFRPEMRAAEAVPREVMARNFQPPTPEIALRVAAGDGAARRLVEPLTEILARAGWKVRGMSEVQAAAPGCRGLTLVAAPTLPLPRVTSTLNALREAGFAMTFQLDPELGPSETVLIVGDGAGSENETALRS